MNNGKIRIYDLSKELNLDNRDILAICEQINLTVKTHSSTISEADAERIKAAAEKYTPSPANKVNIEQLYTPFLKQKPKQQILAIHHKGLKEEQQEGTEMNVTTPSVSPAKSELKPPGSENKNETKSLTKPQSNQTPDRGEKPTVSSNLAKPKLMGPPEREKSQRHQAKDKPTIITRKDKEKGITAEVVTPNKEQRKGELTKEETQKTKEKVKLTRPAKPKTESLGVREIPDDLDLDLDTDELESPTSLIVDDLDEEGLEKTKKNKLKLKRPNAPHVAKKSKWEEEEEEKNNQSKLAKTKNKRRQLLLDEDEDDLESELGSVALPSSVSISIARPPKPPSSKETNTISPGPTQKQKASPRQKGGRSENKDRRREKSTVKEKPEFITLSGSLTVRELAEQLCVPETDIIKILFFKGMAVSITETLDLDTAKMVAEELEVLVEIPEEKSAATKETEMIEVGDLENLQHRPPVVTIMGHVDHGKTTLLDSIRKTKVAQGEAGGITQHIGAYHVDIEHNGKMEQIVFLDTPGHEAFTAMRARGARVTDIAILVVAADDGVQPQTREAISHARAAGVPIVVAVNKIDKAGAEPDRVKQELSELGLVPEEWGGETIMVPVSALKGENLDTLLEMLLLVAEIGELSANPDRKAKGTVIEANLDRSRGPVATLLVQNGTLRVGDIIVVGSVFGKIRAMIDDRGEKVEAASPSFAVEVLGLNDVPAAGDEFDVYDNEKEARAIAESRHENQRQSRLQQAMSSRRVSLSSLSQKAQEGELKELNLILKADVQGSVEAILGSLQQLPQNEVQIRVLFSSPGEVTETDVDLAAASGAVIIGFNTTLASGARAAADREGVDIREYNIIYKLLDEIEGAMEGLLDPEEIEEPLGQAEVRAVFSVGRGSVAGCYVLSGKIIRNRLLRVKRGNQIVYQGPLDTLKRMKEDVKEVNAGFECGINSQKFNDWQEGDIIEVYQMVLKRRTLSK
jgi:translation initiation factor IF-2